MSISCLFRGLPLLLHAAPRTPLRVLCIVALDTIRALRYSQRLPRSTRQALAMFLDFQACTNALWDGKPVCIAEYEALRRRLIDAGLGTWITEYLSRLRELERRRPPVGGDLRRFADVRLYREAVARLSLSAIAAIALDAECLEDLVRSTDRDSDVAALFRMAMQCQIIDDVVDYRDDLSAGLPSFLTACASPGQALASTADAARFYAASAPCSPGRGVFPLEAALSVLTAVTKLVVSAAVLRYGIEPSSRVQDMSHSHRTLIDRQDDDNASSSRGMRCDSH